jgi:hypothetical protein
MREMLLRVDLERAMEWTSWYWWHMAATWHIQGDHAAELDITDRWRDSAALEWGVTRGRALAALGREREVMALLATSAGVSVDSVAGDHLTIATELAVHGRPRPAMAIAEALLGRFELEPDSGLRRASNIAWANRLLGRTEHERRALEQIVRSDPDTLAGLDAEARIAVLLADTARAGRIDSILAEKSARPLRDPYIRGAEIIVRAHLAAGFGRRERAVALLRDASARGRIQWGPTHAYHQWGPSHAYHQDLLLMPLRGYPPFDALLKPDN